MQTQRTIEQFFARQVDPAGKRLRSRGRCGRARSETTTRWAIESKAFSSSRRDRRTSSSSCMFSIALDKMPPSSSARSSRSSSPPVSTRTPSKTIVPSARRQPRSGTVTVPSRHRVVGARKQLGPVRAHRERRRARIVGARRGAPCDVARIGGGLQYQMTGAAIVDPDRRAIGRRTAGWRHRRTLRGRRVMLSDAETGCAENRRAVPDIALQLFVLPQPEERERREKRVRRLPRPAAGNVVGRFSETDRQQADAFGCRAPAESASAAARRAGAARSGISARSSPTQGRRASTERTRTRARSLRLTAPRDRSTCGRGRSRRRLQRGVPRVVFEKQRADRR